MLISLARSKSFNLPLEIHLCIANPNLTKSVDSGLYERKSIFLLVSKICDMALNSRVNIIQDTLVDLSTGT